MNSALRLRRDRMQRYLDTRSQPCQMCGAPLRPNDCNWVDLHYEYYTDWVKEQNIPDSLGHIGHLHGIKIPLCRKCVEPIESMLKVAAKKNWAQDEENEASKDNTDYIQRWVELEEDC